MGLQPQCWVSCCLQWTVIWQAEGCSGLCTLHSAPLSWVFLGWAGGGLGLLPDKIMIGTIMLLIPGMALMNSVRDMLNNNAINGLFSCIDAVLTAGAIAAGFGVPLILLGG